MLRFKVPNKPRPLRKAEGKDNGGPQTRINKLRKLVTALIRHERIEGAVHYIDESRGYTERLIQYAQHHGDGHQTTMELADYWLLEKDLIHKLFKVIVPRYSNFDGPFTQLHKLPKKNGVIPMACIELKGNPWPPIVYNNNTEGNILNVLLDAAKKEHRQKVYSDIANNKHFANQETDSNNVKKSPANNDSTDDRDT